MTPQQRSTVGARLAAERRRRKWTQLQMAKALRRELPGTQIPDPDTILSYVKRWEAGRVGISERYRIAYSAALDIPEDELFAASPNEEHSDAVPLGTLQATALVDDWDDMERRRLLLATLGMGAGALSTSGESVRQLLDLVLASETRSIEDWELACVDHLHALRTRPPAQVKNDLLIDLVAVQRQIKTAGDGDLPELQRVVAALSTLHANILTRLGDHGAAIHWWRTARTAADASRDLELRLGVRATEAGHGLYGQRDPRTVLRLTKNAQGIAGQAPSLGAALVCCSRAKALTLLGRHEEAVRQLNDYRDRAASAPEPKGIMPGYWKGDQLPFAENMVLSGAGKESEAAQAGQTVLSSSNPDYNLTTQVRLNGALCTLANGGVEQGAREAAAALDALPAQYRNHLITETGKRLLHFVPVAHRERPAVREFREVLAVTAPSQGS
ncbi:hypothetical protein ACQP1W_46200 [Spirillospora sp. CA-255316]